MAERDSLRVLCMCPQTAETALGAILMLKLIPSSASWQRPGCGHTDYKVGWCDGWCDLERRSNRTCRSKRWESCSFGRTCAWLLYIIVSCLQALDGSRHVSSQRSFVLEALTVLTSEMNEYVLIYRSEVNTHWLIFLISSHHVTLNLLWCHLKLPGRACVMLSCQVLDDSHVDIYIWCAPNRGSGIKRFSLIQKTEPLIFTP